MRRVIACLVLASCFVALSYDRSPAQGGSTKIEVEYRTRTAMISPMTRQGSAKVNLRLVLKPGGKVEENRSASGRNPTKRSASRDLGPARDRVTYRVVDEATILRVADFKSPVQTLTIRVRGSTCTATLENKLKDGFKQYEAYSTYLGKMATFSSLGATDMRCRIGNA